MMSLQSSFTKISPYVPMGLVFSSGLGFSLQSLILKNLVMNGYPHIGITCVFVRGMVQFIVCSLLVIFDVNRPKNLFGDTRFVQWMVFLRGVIGYGGIAFSFLSVELLPIGDASVLSMLSPLFASIIAFLLLGEPWKLPEFIGTVMSLVGATFVAHPTIIFGGQPANLLGVFFALMSSLTAGCAYICVRILGTTAKLPFANICVGQSIAQMVLSIPTGYLMKTPVDLNVGINNFLLLVLGGLIGCLSQIAMTIGMQKEKSALATAMRMSDVIFGFLWQVLFTTDIPSISSIFGATLVTGSICLIVICKPISKPNPLEVQRGIENGVEMIEKSEHNFLSSRESDVLTDEETISVSSDVSVPNSSGSSSLKMLANWNQSIRAKFRSIYFSSSAASGSKDPSLNQNQAETIVLSPIYTSIRDTDFDLEHENRQKIAN